MPTTDDKVIDLLLSPKANKGWRMGYLMLILALLSAVLTVVSLATLGTDEFDRMLDSTPEQFLLFLIGLIGFLFLLPFGYVLITFKILSTQKQQIDSLTTSVSKLQSQATDDSAVTGSGA
jgi:hypothetical protein